MLLSLELDGAEVTFIRKENKRLKNVPVPQMSKEVIE